MSSAHPVIQTGIRWLDSGVPYFSCVASTPTINLSLQNVAGSHSGCHLDIGQILAHQSRVPTIARATAPRFASFSMNTGIWKRL